MDEPADIAAAVAFLASDDVAAISGVTLPVGAPACPTMPDMSSLPLGSRWSNVKCHIWVSAELEAT